MIPAVSQDPEVIQYCTEFDTYLNFVKQTEQDLRVAVNFEVETDLLTLFVTASFPAISEVELKSEKYNTRSSTFNVDTQALKLEIKLLNLDSFEAEIILGLGQQAFSFEVTIDPENPDGFTDVLDLPKTPAVWRNQKKSNHLIESVLGFNHDIRDIVNEFRCQVMVGDVVTLKKNRVGRVCYIGPIGEKKGVFYGVDLFMGVGKHDGVKDGKRYFQARTPQGGCFVRAKSIVGFGICGGDAELKPRMSGIKETEMHGLMFQPDWLPPVQVVTCADENRPGYDAMPSHEYRDDPRTLKKKVALLANLISLSENCMAYTGAGISTTAGIDDYASKKTRKKSKMNEKRRKVKNFRYAEPTLGHRVLTELYHAGHLKNWVQQNHDGLPQKAGFPQHEINEIHGAWWDVSNAVVPMSGSLRDDLHTWMCEWQEKADLCLAMGTSLCGMNADACVTEPAERFKDDQDGCGSIIIGLQRTPLDDISSIRFYGTIDEIVSLLSREMGLMIRPLKKLVPDIPKDQQLDEWVFKVPYDSEGKLTENPDEMIIWDLRQDQKMIMTIGSGKGFEGTITGFYPDTPHLGVLTRRQYQGKHFGKKLRTYYMGNWWLETVTKGLWHTIPMINKNVVLQKDYEENPTTTLAIYNDTKNETN